MRFRDAQRKVMREFRSLILGENPYETCEGAVNCPSDDMERWPEEEVEGMVAHGNAYHLAETRLGNPRWLHPEQYGATSQTGTANRVFINSIRVLRAMTVDEILFRCSVISGGNFRLGIYEEGPGGGTPLGGDLLWDSGNFMPAGAGPHCRSITPNVSLERGLCFVCLATSDATMAFYRGGTSWLTGCTHPMIEGCRYTLGAWGALTDPCPAVTHSGGDCKVAIFLHVASVDE